MLITILICLIVSCVGLDLSAPSTNIIKKFDSTFHIAENNMMSQIQTLNDHRYSLQESMLKQIAKEIEVLADSESKFVHNTWTFTISNNFASLDYILVHIDINESRQAHVTGGIVRLSQHVPQQYNVEQKCARTGSRIYGICGPRHLECHNHHVPRGLHQHEINQVISHLNSHSSTAQKLLM